MRGYPKYLNTKEDYNYVLKHFSKHEYIKDFQNLKDDYKKWMKEEKLAGKEDGITDKVSKIIEEENEKKEKIYYQYRYKVDPNCKLKRLGMKLIDVDKISRKNE